MRATAPGWLSTGIVNCLVLAMRSLLVAAIIRPRVKQNAATLNLLAFPAAAPEEENSSRGDSRLGDNDGNVHAVRSHVRGDGEKIGQRNLQQPEAEKMDPSRRDCVARAVEGLEHHHAIRVGDVAVAQHA